MLKYCPFCSLSMETYSQQTAKKKKAAAEVSLDRIRRSIEGALEKEKQTVEKESLNQCIRDASVRMSLNLPIKPIQHHIKEHPQKDKRHYHQSDYKLPSLQHGDKSPTKKTDEQLRTLENTVVHDAHTTHKESQNSVRLPPIIIDTGQREKIGKRKRKKEDNGLQIESKEQKRNSPMLGAPVASKSRQGISSGDEELSVVMCGRAPNMQDRETELFVSKHGRFKSK